MNKHEGMPKKRKSFEYLAGLYETDDKVVCRAWLDLICPNDAQDIVSSSALTLTGLAWEIPVDGGDHRGIEWQEVREVKPGEFYWFNVDEGYVPVTEGQQRQYLYDRHWLPMMLKRLLGLSGEQETVIPEQLELLGNIQVDGEFYQVLLARHLTRMEGFKTIYQALEGWKGKASGVVLTVSERLDRLLPLPGDYPALSIIQLLSDDSSCALDVQKLKGILRRTYCSNDESLEVQWDCYENVGRFEANGREPWEFEGTQRCKVASMIYEAWLMGNRGVTTSQIRAEGIGYTRPSNSFSGEEWKSYIHYEKRLWSLKAKPRPRKRSVT